MIRRDWEGGWLLISQPEHARVSGALAEHWGAGQFLRPEPWGENLLATYEHDNGWREWEERPSLNAEGAPAQFTETPIHVNFDIFRRGVKRLYDQGRPYAAALVSRHAGNVYGGVRRLRPARAEEGPKIEAYISEHERRQEEICRELMARPGYAWAATKEGLRQNGRFVTALDTFSLVLCCGWTHLNRVREVPAGDADFDVIALELTDGVRLKVTPWPFDCDRLEVSARGRALPARPFRRAEDLHAALAQTPSSEIIFRLTPG